MKSYLVEVELTKTVRQRTQVVVTTECNLLDEDVLSEIENEADRAIKKGGNSVAWTDVPGTEHRGGNPKYRISPVLVAMDRNEDEEKEARNETLATHPHHGACVRRGHRSRAANARADGVALLGRERRGGELVKGKEK